MDIHLDMDQAVARIHGLNRPELRAVVAATLDAVMASST
jgi:hypothetical protein